MELYNLDEILAYAQRNKIDISPVDRGDWAMFCCALKMLGYSLQTFAALSNCSPAECAKKWNEEKNPSRYFGGDENRAKGELIKLAKAAGINLRLFAVSQINRSKSNFAVNCGNCGKGEKNGSAFYVKANIFDKPKAPTFVTENIVTGATKPPMYVARSVIRDKEELSRRSALYKFLCTHFSPDEVQRVFELYHVGGTKEFVRSCKSIGSAFPYINIDGNCVDIHLMAYNADGHRVKEGYGQNWQLAKDGSSDRRAPWCVFGEHLAARYPEKLVAVVESEKTALICSMWCPTYIWVACGSMQNISLSRLSGIRDKVMLFMPDYDGIEAWSLKIKQLQKAGLKAYLCADFISRFAVEDKDDIADIVLRGR